MTTAKQEAVENESVHADVQKNIAERDLLEKEQPAIDDIVQQEEALNEHCKEAYDAIINLDFISFYVELRMCSPKTKLHSRTNKRLLMLLRFVKRNVFVTNYEKQNKINGSFIKYIR
jgi:hypothetical protein